jgi:hypothetical protein
MFMGFLTRVEMRLWWRRFARIARAGNAPGRAKAIAIYSGQKMARDLEVAGHLVQIFKMNQVDGYFDLWW